MTDYQEYTDQIAGYLDGKMTPDERARFESELQRNAELREAVSDVRQIRLGLRILDAVSGEHVDSWSLAQFTSEPATLDKGVAARIREHLALCIDCREELSLCRQTMAPAEAAKPVISQNPLAAFVTWLIAPRLVLRPAYAMIVLAVLLVPLAYFGLRIEQPESTLSVGLVPVGARSDAAGVREITIGSSLGIIRLQSGLPDIENEPCVFSLYFDADRKLEFVRHDSLGGNSFALDIPATYFRRDGRYTLRVQKQADEGAQAVPYEFRLRIIHSR